MQQNLYLRRILPCRFVHFAAGGYSHRKVRSAWSCTAPVSYTQLDVYKRQVSISVDTNAAHFVDATAKTHRESYRSGLCSVCITNIRNVQDTLAAEGIPRSEEHTSELQSQR